MPPTPLDLSERCHPCWLPGSHTLDEHFERADSVVRADLADYGIDPPRPVEATLTG